MHRREFVKRSRSSRLGGEKKNRREKPRSPSFFLLFLPLFSSLVPKIIGRSSWRRATSNASEVSSKPRRFRWNANFSPLPPAAILFSASWRRLFERFPLFLFLFPLPSRRVSRHDCAVQLATTCI